MWTQALENRAVPKVRPAQGLKIVNHKHAVSPLVVNFFDCRSAGLLESKTSRADWFLGSGANPVRRKTPRYRYARGAGVSPLLFVFVFVSVLC